MSKIFTEAFTSSLKGMYKVGVWLYGQQRLNQEVGARFATKKEIKELINSSNQGVLVDGMESRLSETRSFQSVGVFAPPGYGKTAGFIIPNILDKARQRCSLLITDPSGEIYQNTSAYLHSQGYDIHLINPTEPEISSLFNPFESLNHQHLDQIGALCSAIILSKYGNDKEPIWNDGAIDILELLAKCLAYSCPEQLTLPNLNTLVQKFGANGQALDDWVASHSFNPSTTDDTSIIEAWKSLIAQEGKMLNSFVTILRTALKPFNNRQVQQLFSGNDIDFKQFRQKKTAIYLSLKENKLHYYQFLIDLFYTKFFDAMMQSPPHRKSLDVYCYLDEFGHSYIDGFSNIINNIRKYRVSVSMVFQNIAQITARYGQEEGSAIKSAMANSIILAGTDIRTAREQSEKIGKRVIQQRKSVEDTLEHYTQLDLLPPEQIRTLTADQLLFISGNHHPFITHFVNFFDRKSKYHSASKKGSYPMPPKKRVPVNKLVI